MQKRIRTLIADHDVDFSHELRDFLDQQDDILVIDAVRDGLGAVRASKEAFPDIIVMDLRLPVVDTVRAIQSIKAQNDLAKILVLSKLPEDRYAIEAVKSGACGFVVKNGPGTLAIVADAVRKVSGGEVVLNSALASHILQEFSQA